MAIIPTARDQLKRLSRGIGAMLLACSVLYGYGALSDLHSKVNLRLYGQHVHGSITHYDAHFTGEYPMVSYRTYLGETITVVSSERFFSWAAPAVGSTVEVCYDPNHPSHFQLFLNAGLAQFSWLELPAALAFLFTFLLITSLRFLLY